MPLFARAGAVIPVSVGRPQSVEDITQVMFEVFPGNGCYVHNMDDGETFGYQKGEIRKITVTVRGKRAEQRVTDDGYTGPDSLEIRWMA